MPSFKRKMMLIYSRQTSLLRLEARARFEIPARVKTDPILNNYLTQTMENNARSGVRRL